MSTGTNKEYSKPFKGRSLSRLPGTHTKWQKQCPRMRGFNFSELNQMYVVCWSNFSSSTKIFWGLLWSSPPFFMSSGNLNFNRLSVLWAFFRPSFKACIGSPLIYTLRRTTTYWKRSLFCHYFSVCHEISLALLYQDISYFTCIVVTYCITFFTSVLPDFLRTLYLVLIISEGILLNRSR